MSGVFLSLVLGDVARRLDASAGVLVFIDGQNVHKTCERLYGHGYVHPVLLAQRVLAGRTLRGFRYYSGMPDPRVAPGRHAAAQRRHNLIRLTGGTVVERPLRYRWEWGFNPRTLPDPLQHRAETREVAVSPYQRAREKGIDLTLGLDVVDLALRGSMDVAVVISSDADLTEVARAVHEMTRTQGRVSVEAGVLNEQRAPILLRHYDYTHQLRRNDFEEARDSFDYRNPLDRRLQEAFLATCTPLRPRST